MANQLRVLRSEDVRAQPRIAVRDVLAFLSLAPSRAAELVAEAAQRAVVPQRQAKSPQISFRLRDFYEEFNAELAHLLDGDKRFAYPRSEHHPSEAANLAYM